MFHYSKSKILINKEQSNNKKQQIKRVPQDFSLQNPGTQNML